MSFREIAEDLARRIADGEYPPGAKLPSYAEVAAMYSVSVTTAQKALILLRERVETETKPGVGTFIPKADEG